MNTVKLAKVITLYTKESKSDCFMQAVTTVPAETNPQAVFKVLGLEGCVKRYEVSKIMPLPIALTYSQQLMQKYHII